MMDDDNLMTERTERPANGIMPMTDEAPMDRTLRPESAAMPLMGTEQQEQQQTKPTVFNLKGDEYEQEECLSDNSGEAQVFLVKRDGEEYVLKVYYPSFDINKQLLQVIRSFHYEMIVDLIDFGKTYLDGKNRYYELMEYLRGGTLQDLKLDDNYDLFRRIALMGASALAYCHKSNVLHKDVKPANFFFRDKEHKELVLGDFGISALREEGKAHFRTTQARTPVYAAPEMYADVIDGVVDINEAADYYSLGMTLFALWLGETPMSSNERTMMRQKNEGRLPRLEELPDAVKRIIQGLTSVNQQTRWGYKEVERWFLGEDVQVDLTSPFLRYKSFIVDPERNLVADNVHDLVPLLIDNDMLGINYLYNGRIVSWLESCGNTKLSAIVKDIVSNKYKNDQRAGLMAACYAMEPTMCYRDVEGLECEDVHQISMSLLSFQEKYSILLRNPNDPLFLWLESHTKCNVNRLRSYFDEGADSRIAVLRVIYEIDPEMPFLPRQKSSTLPEITHAFGHAHLNDDAWHSLCDGRFLSWTYCHEDIMVAEILESMTKGQPYSKSLAYKVLYKLDHTAAYDLRDASTPQQVGELLSKELMQQEHANDATLAEQMADFTNPDGRFFYYATLHGWQEYLTQARQCFDLNSEENRERLGAYDLRTALYRFCCILGVKPRYLLPDGTVLADGRSIDLQFVPLVRDEMKEGAFAQWLSVFYHENPAYDFSEEYSYEHELQRWIMALGKYDNRQDYYRRFTKACEETTTRVEEVHRLWAGARNKERVWKYGFFALSAVWAVMLFIFGLDDRSYLFEHHFLTMITPLGVMTGIIVGTRSYFRGYGSTISMLFGGLGFLTAYIPYYILQYVDAHLPDMFHLTIVGLTAVYVLVAYLTDLGRTQHSDEKFVKKVLTDNDIKSSLIEPLYFTFKTRSQRYKASRFSLLDEVADQVKSISGESVIHYVLWMLTVIVLILELCLFSPKLIGWHQENKAIQESVER